MEIPRPARSYLVCATPRSGSTLLCEMLRETGHAGNPLEHFETLRSTGLPRQPRQYFTDLADAEVHGLLAETDPGTRDARPAEAWWADVLAAGQGADGTWGGKLMWGHVPELLGHARGLPGLAGADLDQALRGLFGDPHLVFVTRADKVSQAVSLWRAAQSRSWRAGVGERRDTQLAYSFAAIDHLRRQLADHEAAWERWFAERDFLPIRVAYDELDADPHRVVGAVLRELGLGDPAEVPDPPLTRQRDELSASWVERYVRDAAEVAA
jgi:trehalose 2-sulfotransferase